MRVIAGALGGRTLTAPRGRGTRPTSDRVREALFSVLGSVDGARILELYAGSGAVSIEALSRGAEAAVLVERAAGALAALRHNLTACELDDCCRVMPMSVSAAVGAILAAGPYDLVFADPPYADRRAPADLERLLSRRGVLAAGARMVLEHAWRSPASTPASLELHRRRRYGDTALSFYGCAR